MSRSEPPTWKLARHRDAWAAPFGLGLLLLMGLRGLLEGAGPGDVVAHALFLTAYVMLPGWLAYQLFRAPDDDWIMALGMGWTLGYVIQLAVYIGLKPVGASWLYPFFPILLLPLAALARGSRSSAAVASPRLSHGVLLLGILLLAVERTPLLAHWWLAGDPDFGFHVGSAAELKHHWPLRDPRVAGEPWNYHFFSYAFPAGASQVTGIPIAALLHRLAAPALPVLLGLQVFNAGRVYGGSAVAGLLAAALILLHADLGVPIFELLGSAGRSEGFRSYLALGVYSSISTVLGLVLFASLAIALRRWLTGSSPDRRALGLAAILAAAASGAKGSVMPVVLAGLGALVAWTWLVRRRGAGRALAAGVLLTLASAPMTLLLTVGQASYASAMFGVEPLRVMLDSDFYRTIGSWLGFEAAWLPPLLAPLWLLGFLGIGGVTGLLFLWRERQHLDDAQRWLAWTFATGLVPALVLAASGMSQVFFLYNGQVALAVLGGAWLASQGMPRHGGRIALALALAVLALPTLLGAARETAGQLARDWGPRSPASALEAEYSEGLRWVREATPRDALFLTNHGFILVSAFGERRVFYETDWFAAAALAHRSAQRWGSSSSRIREQPVHPFVPRVRALLRFFEHPDPDSARALRAFARQAGEMYLVVDSVAKRVGRGWGSYEIQAPGAPKDFESSPLLAPVFGNQALRIYRVEDRSPPRGSSRAPR